MPSRDPTSNSPQPDLPRWEVWAVWLVLAAFAVVAGDAIRNRATYGQDFNFHDYATRGMLANPGVWFVNSTSRPLLYWIGGFCLRITRDHSPYLLASGFFVVLAAAAIKLLHSACLRMIRTPSLRVAAILFLAFLPATVVTTVVYASDTLALLPFVLTGWSLVRALEAPSARQAAGYYGLCGLALLAGNFSKATFAVLPAAVVAVLAAAVFRAKIIAPSRLWMPLLFCVAAPLAVSGWLHIENRRQLPGVAPLHRFNWGGTGQFTFRSVAGLKRSDVRILAAPGYWDRGVERDGPPYPLLANNNYSYAALLQLSLFTDVLNFTNPAHLDRNDAPRPPAQVVAARRAVRFGLFFSAPAFAAVAAFSVGVVIWLVRAGRPFPVVPFIWYTLALAWFAPLVLSLPFVYDAYDYGYWLPRLTLPAIWIFFILYFAAIDRLALKIGPAVGYLVFGAVCLQSAFEIQSIFR